MAQTRGATGHAAPRVFLNVDTAPANPRKAPTTKRTTKKKAATGAGVKKTTATQKRKTTVKDKIAGTAKKAVGKVQGKPGKVGAGTKKIRGTDGKGAKAVKK